MAIFNEELPEWQNAGSKPTNDVIAAGWKVGDRPPAAWFNWAWERTYQCLDEVRTYLETISQGKQTIELLTATYDNGNYIATSAMPNSAYIDGMIINVKVDTDSIENSKINLDGLGLKDIYIDGRNTRLIGSKTMSANKIYTLIYNTSLNGWYIANATSSLSLPPSYSGNLNNIQYDSIVLTNASTTNMPDTMVANDYFIIETTMVTNPAGTRQWFQRAKSLITFNEYNRLLSFSGTVDVNWTFADNDSITKQINNMDVFSNLMGSGLGLTFTSVSPYNVSINAGYIYLTSGLVTKNAAQALSMPAVTDGNYYIWIAKNGRCTIHKSGTTLDGYSTILYRLTMASSQLSLTENRVSAISLNADKLKTARQIAISGDVIGSANFDGSANTNISVMRKGCLAGSNAIATANLWYKVASLTTTVTGYNDRSIILLVDYGRNVGSFDKVSGILKVAVRFGSGGMIPSGSGSIFVEWLSANSRIDVNNFVVAYAPNTTNNVIEIWCKISESYQTIKFEVLSENNSTVRGSFFDMINATVPAETPTVGYNQVVSTAPNQLGYIANATSSDKLLNTKLTNENIDNFIGSNYWGKEYYGHFDNTVTTKPSTITNFLLIVQRSSDGNTIQIIIGGITNFIYTRYWNGSVWTTWSSVYSGDNPQPSLPTYTITSQDINTFRGSSYWGRLYYAASGNTSTNKPDGVDAYSLEVFRIGGTGTLQRLTQEVAAGKIYTRVYNASTGVWSNWKRLVEESIQADVTVPANGWTGSSAPYSATITNANITATNVVEVIPQSTIILAHANAIAAAMILSATQASGSITLKAFGTKPPLDLPLTLIIRGDL